MGQDLMDGKLLLHLSIHQLDYVLLQALTVDCQVLLGLKVN